jgi:uncharacterized membrane protein
MVDDGSSGAEPAEVHQEIERLVSAHRVRQERKRLPRWTPLALKLLPHVLITVTILNALIGFVAIVTPWLTGWFGTGFTDPIYRAYSFICPQRPSHTWFIDGRPMAFEQRDVAMHLGFALAGFLYAFRTAWLRRPLPTTLFVLGILPLFIDVAISTLDIRPSTPFSRLWTGLFCSFVIVWWSYPRFDGYLEEVRRKARRLGISS